MAHKIAIDTNVLSHALALRRIGSATAMHARDQACRQLVENGRDIWVPVPVVAELLRIVAVHETKAFDDCLARMPTLAVTAPAARRAGQLLARTHNSKQFCPKCLEPSGDYQCIACKRLRAQSSQFSDALIAAVVLEQPGDWTIYTYNLKHFEHLLVDQDRVKAEEPPPYRSDQPLLERVGEQVAPVQRKSKA